MSGLNRSHDYGSRVTTTSRLSASGIGVATYGANGQLLDVWYPSPVLSPTPTALASLEAASGSDPIRGTTSTVITTVIEDLGAEPVDAADAYLRLHLLSHRLVQPHGLNLA